MRKAILYLASASPRRHEILKQLQIPHCVLLLPPPPGEDEPQLPGEPPYDYVRRTSREKALRATAWLKDRPEQTQKFIAAKYRSHCVIHTMPGSSPDNDATARDENTGKLTVGTVPYVLSADTSVILDGNILGKPRDHDHAFKILKSLSGRTHQVHTAITLSYDSKLSEAVSVSTVRFKDLSDSEITRYCETGDPMGKAGAYGIQGPAAAFVSQLCGSYTGVMGLPAFETATLLAASGYR